MQEYSNMINGKYFNPCWNGGQYPVGRYLFVSFYFWWSPTIMHWCAWRICCKILFRGKEMANLYLKRN